MNISKVYEEIKHSVEIYLQKDEFGQYVIAPNKQRPLFLIGAPGIGKTAIVGQVAAELNLGYVSYSITHHTRQSAIGLPFITKKRFGDEDISVTEYTLSEIIASIYEAIEKQNQKEGILFIDEINCVSETLAPAMLDLLQNKKFGPHKIPVGWVLISAGNPVEFNKSAREFDTTTLDRIKKINVDTSFEIWKPYAYRSLIHNSIMYYLQLKPQNVIRIEKSIHGDLFVTPRAWEDLSLMIKNYMNRNYVIDFDVIQQYIQHEEIARDFHNYFLLYLKYEEKYHISDIFEGNGLAWTDELQKSKFDEKIAFINMLIDYLNQQINENIDSQLKQEMVDTMYRSIEKLTKPEVILRLEKLLVINNQILTNNVISERERRTRIWFKEEIVNFHQKLSIEEVGIFEVANHIKLLREKFKNGSQKIVFDIHIALNFLDTTFGKSQEMVLFLMNMLTSRDVVNFLQINPSESFNDLCEEMLLGERNKMLLTEIETYRSTSINDN